MPTSTIARDVARRLARIGRSQGLDMPRLLRRIGIDGADGLPRGAVTVEQAAALTQELWLLTGDELFGLGEPAPLGSFALMMRSAIHVPDLRGFLERVAQAGEVLPALPRFALTESDAEARVSFGVESFDDPDHFAGEILAVLIHRVLGWVTGVRIPLAAVELPWPAPSYAADYEIVFGVHPSFDHTAVCLVLDRRHLATPVIRDDADLADYLSDQPRVWYSTRDYESSVAQQVRSILQRGLRGSWPTPEEIAGQLSVSAQHLRRLLRAENSSIGLVKEEVLREAAIASLRRGDESQEALATRLGFSEASAFRRAFRRWTGTSPSSYRPDARDTGTS